MTRQSFQPLQTNNFQIDLLDESGQGTVYMIEQGKKQYRLRYCDGTAWIEPWIEIDPSQELSPRDPIDQSLIEQCHTILESGSHLMVQYTDTITAEALTIDIPPAATPIGYLLFTNGFTWFKDWYIAEGWREGGQKLQGNISQDPSTIETVHTEISNYLEDPYGPERCRELAQQIRDQA